MIYKITKYSLLTVFILLTLYQNAPISDYCYGLAHVIAFILFGGLFLLTFLIYTFIDLYQLIRFKKRFDYLLLVLLGLFLMINYVFLNFEDKKMWTDKVCIGRVQDQNDLNAASIILYENFTFAVTNSYVDWSCTYQGNFGIKDEILTLKRKDLPELTKNIFTDKYKFDLKDSLLIPVDNGFEKIKIKLWKN